MLPAGPCRTGLLGGRFDSWPSRAQNEQGVWVQLAQRDRLRQIAIETTIDLISSFHALQVQVELLTTLQAVVVVLKGSKFNERGLISRPSLKAVGQFSLLRQVVCKQVHLVQKAVQLIIRVLVPQELVLLVGVVEHFLLVGNVHVGEDDAHVRAHKLAIDVLVSHLASS